MSGYHDGFTEGYEKGVEDTLVELRAAVDALRPMATYARSIACNGARAMRVAWNSPYELTIGDCQDAFTIVTAFDAKYPEAK